MEKAKDQSVDAKSGGELDELKNRLELTKRAQAGSDKWVSDLTAENAALRAELEEAGKANDKPPRTWWWKRSECGRIARQSSCS